MQYVVLSNIATMSIKQKGMFEPFLKSFYVRSNDPTHVKLLKLEILTNLATETNISTILRELQVIPNTHVWQECIYWCCYNKYIVRLQFIDFYSDH